MHACIFAAIALVAAWPIFLWLPGRIRVAQICSRSFRPYFRCAGHLSCFAAPACATIATCCAARCAKWRALCSARCRACPSASSQRRGPENMSCRALQRASRKALSMSRARAWRRQLSRATWTLRRRRRSSYSLMKPVDMSFFAFARLARPCLLASCFCFCALSQPRLHAHRSNEKAAQKSDENSLIEPNCK